ncbi:MAG: TRAP transporter TatT component family protein, partial [bacterium]
MSSKPTHTPSWIVSAALILGLAFPFLSGCSTTKLAVGAMGPILDNSKTAALASDDIRTFNAATPSSLFLLEGLIKTDPKNTDLRLSAAMLYFSFAFTFDKPEDESYASSLYLRGFDHAKAVLLRNKKVAAVWDKPFDEFAEGVQAVTKKDIEALVWTVANWSQFIALHLDSTEVLVQIPRVTTLLDRAVEIDGAYFEGLPYMILGSLHAFRPPMMGGDPDASLKNFDEAFGVSDRKFLLASYLYAKFYCYRVQDAEDFEKTLEYVIAQPDTILPDYRLLNAIAKQKAAVL